MKTMNSTGAKREFLATTALETFWDETAPILFLGDWCTSYKNRKLWERLDAETLDPPQQDMSITLREVDKIYSDLLPKIAKWLNSVHSVDYSIKYWEIVLGSFLLMHILIIYDRFYHLKRAYTLNPEFNTIGLHTNSFVTPIDSHEYHGLIHQDHWNLQVFTQLISLNFKKPISFFSYDSDIKKNRIEKLKNRNSYRFFTRIRINFAWMIAKLRGHKTVSLMSAFIQKKHLFFFMLSSRFKILLLEPRKVATDDYFKLLDVSPDHSLRSQLTKISVADELSKSILALLAVNMPMSFIENYNAMCVISQKHYPYFVKAVYGAGGFTPDSVKLWTAKNQEKGLLRIGSQHGRCYDLLKSSPNQFLEHKTSDFYVEFGSQSNGKVIAAPVPFLCEIKDKKIKNCSYSVSKERIIWVTTEFGRYPTLGTPINYNYYRKLYCDWQVNVLSSLSKEIFSSLTMRFRHSDFSDDWRMISDQFPALDFHKPNSKDSFLDHIYTARLLLFDNLNTTYLYGLGLNVPSILFWDERIYELSDQARPYFNVLSEAGIYHNNWKSAVDFINTVGKDPLSWWYSATVQNARKHYCDRYLQYSKSWKKEWKRILVGFVQKKENENSGVL